jgi:hypothetical protein
VAESLAARAPAPAPASGLSFVVRDNIDWSALALRMGTRSAAGLQEKWYRDLAPSMRETGAWASGDDRRLLRALRASGAAEETEVDWGACVEGRAGAAALRRWRLMCKHVPRAVDVGFQGCVAQLVAKFEPALLEGAGAAEGEA